MDKAIEIKGCPFCGAKINHKVKIINFFECPECGAKMDNSEVKSNER